MRGIISSHLKEDNGSMKNEKPFKFSVPKKKKGWVTITYENGHRKPEQ
jgi:hypothetical protein